MSTSEGLKELELIKGVIWCDFKFSFLFGVLQAVHA